MTKKLSLEEFRIFKKILKNIEEENFENEYYKLQEELLSYDLSDIPFEEWKGFEIYSSDEHIADFSKTHANIDFSLVDLDGYFVPGNFKGCNVKNIDEDLNLINPDSFDDNTINNNSSLFLSNIFTSLFKEKYYARKLTMDDLIDLNEEQVGELDNKSISLHLRLNTEEDMIDDIVVTEMKLDKGIELYKYSKDEYNFVGQILYFMMVSSKQVYIKNRARELCKTLNNSNVENIKNICNSYLRDFILKEGSYKIFLSQIPELFINENKDLFLLDKDISDYMRNIYYARELTIEDVFYNLDVFDRFPIDNFIDDTFITNKMIRGLGYGSLTKLMIKYHEFFEYIIENKRISEFSGIFNYIKKKKGEKKFKEAVKEFYAIGHPDKSNFPNWLFEMNFEIVEKLKDSNDLMEYNDDMLILDDHQRTLINLFGIDNLKRLQEETKIFSGTIYSFENFNKLARCISSNMIDLNLISTEKGEIFDDPNLTYDMFEKEFASYLEILRANNSSLNIDFIEGSFRTKYPQIFMDKNASYKLREAFYSNEITPKFLFDHSEYIPYLLDKDLLNTIKITIKNNEGYLPPRNFITIYIKKHGKEKLLKLIVKYGDFFDSLNINCLSDKKEEKIEQAIQDSIYKKIIKLNNAEYYDYSHLRFVKEFKERYPGLFADFSKLKNIDNDTIAELQRKYYNGSLSYDDIRVYPQLIEILKDKNLKCCFRKFNDLFTIKNDFFSTRVHLLDLVDSIENEKFLRLCKKYGIYLRDIMHDLYEYEYEYKSIKNFTFLEIDNKLEEILIKGCFNGKIRYKPENAPKFLKEKHPELFLSEDAPEILKYYFYGIEADNFSFRILANHRDWLPYLKDKSIKTALLKGIGNEYMLNFFFDEFGIDSAIKLGMKKYDTVMYILSLCGKEKIIIMKKWYDRTGCKFIPDIVVMENINIEESDKFFLNTTNWNKLMKLEEFSESYEVREGMLKLAYSFGVFDGDMRGFNKLYDLLTKIPKKIDELSYYQINDIALKKLFNVEEDNCNIDYFIYYYNTIMKNLDDLYFAGEGISKDNLLNLLNAMKEENFNLDYSKGIISQIYIKNDDNTYTLIINQQRYPKTIKAIRDFLIYSDVDTILTREKVHQLFGGFKMEYNPDFREFLLDNLDEILSNSEYSTYITSIQKQFKDIKRTNSNRKLTLDLAISYVQENRYENVEIGNEGVAEISSIAGYTQEDFDILQRIYNYGKQRVFSSIPRIEGNNQKYTYEMLRLDDPLALAIGTLTDCCQEIGNVAESCMEHSMVDKNGRVFVVRDKEGNIISQSWVWRNKDVLCFDNIEIPDKAFDRVDNKETFTEELYKIYKKAAHKLIEKDEEEYKKLFDAGKITEEQYEGLRLKKVTVGLGYNDIRESLNKNAVRDINVSRPISFKQPVELDRTLYTSDSTIQYILEEKEKMNDYDVETIQVHNDLYKIYDATNITKKELILLGEIEEEQKGYSDILDIIYYDKENYADEISNIYDIDKDNLKVIIHPNFSIIYEDNDKIKIADLFYNTKVGNGRKKTNIEDVVVVMQVRLALDQIGKDKKIDVSELDKNQKEIYNKAMNLKKELDEAKGIKIK